MTDATQIISRIESGDRAASDELLPLVYQELRKLADHKLAHEKPGQTLQATALVHEAYMRLVDQTAKRASLKRGGDRQRIEVEAIEPVVLPLRCDDILGLE